MIADLLARRGIIISYPTTFKYMNEMNLKAIINRKKMKYRAGDKHRVFDNILERKFDVDTPNAVWFTDFTYLQLNGGKKRYNCTIVDLYDRSVVATLNSKYIDSKLAIDTLKLAISKTNHNGNIVLHSDQGAQFSSFAFTTYCEDAGVRQSMSRTGTPGDNAVMERYYNTFKNELINVYSFETDYELNTATEEYAYVRYNHLRPYSYNNKMTPNEARREFYSKL